MMIVERVLVISDENRASPSWKGSIRKAQTGFGGDFKESMKLFL